MRKRLDMKWTWEILQTLLAKAVLSFLTVHSKQPYKNAIVYYIDKKIYISLGRHIIVNRSVSMGTLKHEYGHTIQSKYLGPLYLIVVGLPSITLNILSRIIGGKFADNYYNRFPENWADKLGKVKR